VSAFSLINTACYVHGYDFTTDSNALTLKLAIDDQETTTFQSGGYRTRIAGLRDVEGELQGNWQSDVATVVTGAPDVQAFPDLGIMDRVVTVSPAGNEAETAYIYQAGKFSYELLGGVGEVAPFTLSMKGSNGQGLVRGQLAKARGSVSATGALGSPINLGAPVLGQYVYAAFHVFTAGTTITVQVQSDTASNFPSATTVATIGPLTTQGGTWMTRVAGPFVGETWWRLNVSAITGTFNVAGTIAVQ
jgi:hypothetical protein